MKKIIVILFFSSTIVFGQTNAGKILKISYMGMPISQYQLPKNDSSPENDRKSDISLKQRYKYYYTLYVSPKTSQSLYKFDSLSVKKPKGKEKEILTLNDELAYCIKTTPINYHKFETIFGRKFYSTGAVKDLEWVITAEKKQLMGFECTKAIPKNKDFLINVWFTEEIPVSAGPSNYFGLPGLVVRAEDFFRTTQLEKVEYLDENQYPLAQEIAKTKASFEKNKKKDAIAERIFMQEKAELIQSMIQMMEH